LADANGLSDDAFATAQARNLGQPLPDEGVIFLFGPGYHSDDDDIAALPPLLHLEMETEVARTDRIAEEALADVVRSDIRARVTLVEARHARGEAQRARDAVTSTGADDANAATADALRAAAAEYMNAVDEVRAQQCYHARVRKDVYSDVEDNLIAIFRVRDAIKRRVVAFVALGRAEANHSAAAPSAADISEGDDRARTRFAVANAESSRAGNVFRDASAAVYDADAVYDRAQVDAERALRNQRRANELLAQEEADRMEAERAEADRQRDHLGAADVPADAVTLMRQARAAHYGSRPSAIPEDENPYAHLG
jgi:hypothetical protein